MRGHVRLGWRGLIAFAIFAGLFGLLIAAGQVGDLLIRTLIWAAIARMSALLLLQRFRGERTGSQSTPDTLLKRWHGWAMDESNHR